jgi:hypothetical protein
MASGKPRKSTKAQSATMTEQGSGADSTATDLDSSAQAALESADADAGPGTMLNTNGNADGSAEAIDHEIRREAYHIYLSRGDQPGNAADDWLTAERLVRDRFGSVGDARRS